MATKSETWSADTFEAKPSSDFVLAAPDEKPKVIFARVTHAFHRIVKSQAALSGMTLEEFAREAIADFLEKKDCKGDS